MWISEPRRLKPQMTFVNFRMNGFESARELFLTAFREGGSPIEDYSPTPEDMVEFTGLEGYEEVERYWLNRPYAFVSVLYNDDDKEHYYYVVEPELDEFERRLLDRLYGDVRHVLVTRSFKVEHRSQILREGMQSLIRSYGVEVEPKSFYKMYYYLRRTYVGFGKIDPLLRDDKVEDISCDGYDIPLYLYHQDYQDIKTNVEFEQDGLDSFVTRLAQQSGNHISIEKPIVSATLSDGSRAELTLGREVTRQGSTFTIRKFAEDPFTPVDLVQNGTFSVEQMAYLWMAIENGKSLIFAGGTASGKTTSMNAVSMFIPPRSKVISIEDTPEVQLYHENWVATVTREGIGKESNVDMYTLLRSALRHRPEYIIVGEVRGEEALTLFQAMNTGHTTYSTLHADSVETAINRLENPPINVPRSMLEALDIVSVQVLSRQGDQRLRRTRVLSEIAGIDTRTGDINSNQLFEWDAATDEFQQMGNSVVLDEIREDQGASRSEVMREVDNRRKVLREMMDEDVNDYKEFTQLVKEYYTNPEEVMDGIEDGDLKAVADIEEP